MRRARPTGWPPSVQYDLLTAEPDWAPSPLPDRLGGVVGVDVETRDPGIDAGTGPSWFPGGDGEIIGFSLAWEGGAGYWPLRHVSGNVEDPEAALGRLRDFARDPAITWVSHNSGYELGWFGREGVELAGPVEDTWLAGALLDETRQNSLDALVRLIGERKNDTWLAIGARSLGVPVKRVKGHLKYLPGPYVGAYGEADAVLARRLWLERFEADLRKEDLLRPYLRERRLCRVLVDVRRRGLRVDEGRARVTIQDCQRRQVAAANQIKTLSGVAVDPWAAASLEKAFAARGVALPRTDTGQPSVTTAWLAACEDEVARHVREARRWSKVGQFAEASLRHVVNGRVHPSYNQVRYDDGEGDVRGTITTRLSCEAPNLQQLPARDEDAAAAIRTLYLPEVGERWAACDYAQQEPRLMVHFAALAGLAGGREFADRYRLDPRTDFYDTAVELTGLPRKQAKVIGLGVPYGMGGAKLCKSLGFPVTIQDSRERAGPEGQAILDRFDAALPFVRKLQYKATDAARRRGWVRTAGGGLVRFPLKEGERWWTFKALNRLIQRSAAEQTKEAMVQIHEAGDAGRVLAQIHDELGISVAEPRELQRAMEIMETCFPLEVPSRVDAEVGPTWGDATAEEAQKFLA